jgi:hypothetical protein
MTIKRALLALLSPGRDANGKPARTAAADVMG